MGKSNSDTLNNIKGNINDNLSDINKYNKYSTFKDYI